MIIPLILTIFASKTTKATTLPFESFLISPFYSNKESTIVVNTKSSYLKFFLFIQNDKNMNVCILQDEITSSGKYTYKYDNSYTRTKNKVYVRYSTDGSTYSDSPSIDRNIVRSSYEYITNNQNMYADQTLGIITGDGITIDRHITYSFAGFEGLYIPNYYHKIDLSNFAIGLANSYHPFFTCTPTLTIKNYDNAFKDITGAGETVTFNLKLVEGDHRYTFELADLVYVHTETLKMSSTKKSGYVQTKHIYLPRNEMRNQDKFESYFLFQDFGIDRDMVIHQFEIRALTNIVGDCRNSKYCVIRES